MDSFLGLQTSTLSKSSYVFQTCVYVEEFHNYVYTTV